MRMMLILSNTSLSLAADGTISWNNTFLRECKNRSFFLFSNDI